MSGPGYPATPLLARLSPANGWCHDLVGDDRGELYALVAVRIGPVWTDSVAIVGEDQTLAMRHRTRETDLIVPASCPVSPRPCGVGMAGVRRCSPSCSSCPEERTEA